MKSLYSSFLQSKFYHPAFNAAIFDGPIRIYFAQFHESFALKIYFYFQQKNSTEMGLLREALKKNDRQVMVMIYPSTEAFSMSFENHQYEHGPLAMDNLGQDAVIGIRAPLEDEQMDLLFAAMIESVRSTSLDQRPDPISDEISETFL